jgi:hypothetical protein
MPILTGGLTFLRVTVNIIRKSTSPTNPISSSVIGTNPKVAMTKMEPRHDWIRPNSTSVPALPLRGQNLPQHTCSGSCGIVVVFVFCSSPFVHWSEDDPGKAERDAQEECVYVDSESSDQQKCRNESARRRHSPPLRWRRVRTWLAPVEEDAH